MSRPRKPRDFWDDKETTPKDIERGTANRAQVLKELIKQALATEPLDASRVAQWHKDCFLGLSYVDVVDECLLGAYRGTDHPRLKNMIRLLPVVGIRPRPEHPYGPAAVASMRGDHSKITQFIVALLENPPGGG